MLKEKASARRLVVTLLASIITLAVLWTPAQARTNTATYSNPLLPNIDLADPHVILVDGVYYMYATTHTRAYEVFTSTNLVDWEKKTEVFPDSRAGLWAPDVFHDKNGSGKFYLYYTANAHIPHRGALDKVVGVAEGPSPLGPFEDKGVLATISIDGHLYEEGGKYYFYYVDLDGGFKIMAQRMANPIEKKGHAVKIIYPTEPWEMKSGHVTEGPFLLKRGSTYYMMYSGTGADSPNYGLGYATSKSPMGPFKKFAGNPIVYRYGTVLGPGHHCVVTGPDNQLWMVYHQKWNPDRSFYRFLALDKMWFTPDGQIKAEATREVEKPIPAMLKPAVAR
jgi:beta-xylosidase